MPRSAEGVVVAPQALMVRVAEARSSEIQQPVRTDAAVASAAPLAKQFLQLASVMVTMTSVEAHEAQQSQQAHQVA